MAERDLTGEILFDKLRVLRRLGAGGMGAVYEVEHRYTKHRRALKVLHAEAAMDADVVARFVREAGVAGTIESPYVVETFDAGRLPDGAPYLLMELLRGASLGRMIAERGHLPPSDVAYLGVQVCEGLTAAHRVGIVHRDLKPDNLFLVAGEDGATRAKILDFGISKFTKDISTTQSGIVVGTPQYMSPEQAHGAKDLDARSDVYSLAVVLYECLTGVSPYAHETLAAVLAHIVMGDHVRLEQRMPELDAGLAAVVERAMSLDRAERYASTAELAEALSPYARAVSLVPREPARPKTADDAAPVSAMPLAGQEGIGTAETLASVRVPSPKRVEAPVPLVPERPRRGGVPTPVVVTGLLAIAAVAVTAIVMGSGGAFGGGGAGTPTDAGVAHDAGSELDAGTDAGAATDAGSDTAHDAGAALAPDLGTDLGRRHNLTKAERDGLIISPHPGGH